MQPGETSRRKICVVTGTRAEYGLLYWPMQVLRRDPDFQLQVVATGTHLAPAFGETWREIERDGFAIDYRVQMPLDDDSPAGVTRALGTATIGFADACERLRPDLLLVLGDRYEILAAAQAALIARIPIAHIAGGDTTEGAFDEAIRHGITKMAHLHFVTHAEAARRVRQLGENPAHVHDVGSPGIDRIRRLSPLGREQLEAALGFRLRRRNLLVTYHPETLADQSPVAAVQELLSAFDTLDADTGILITMPNADPGNQGIRELLCRYAAGREHVGLFESLGQERYLSAMRHVDIVVGNSSSGIMEAPSFGKPTVNIGDRQKGRPQAASVVNCAAGAPAITAALHRAAALDCSAVKNPYGDGHASEKIVTVLKNVSDYRALLRKTFFLTVE